MKRNKIYSYHCGGKVMAEFNPYLHKYELVCFNCSRPQDKQPTVKDFANEHKIEGYRNYNK